MIVELDVKSRGIWVTDVGGGWEVSGRGTKQRCTRAPGGAVWSGGTELGPSG